MQPQIRRRRREARSSTSQGRAEPLCARIKGANREVSEGKADLSLTTVFLLLTSATRSGEQARFVGLFQGCTRHWTAGCWLARRLHQLKASTTMDLGISLLLFFCTMCGLEKLGLVDQNWLERNLSALLPRTMVVVGRRQQSNVLIFFPL